MKKKLKLEGVQSKQVLKAMHAVPRHLFVPKEKRACAYEDTPLAIGHGQTISQPSVVALMTDILHLRSMDRVLEVGTGCGYQTAILAELVQAVYTIEIISRLQSRAKHTLAQLGYDNIQFFYGDGYHGWEEHAPYDRIIVTACASHIPSALLDQLAPGGRLVIPVGGEEQHLFLLTRSRRGTLSKKSVVPVRFVRMTGEAAER